MIVVDASVAAKLLIVEADSEQAKTWFHGAPDDLVAPTLIAVEVAQAVVRRVNAGEAPLTDGKTALRRWRDLLDGGGIILIESNPALVEKAGMIAMEIGHPVKDCLYLALATERAAALMTADAKFHRKATAVYSAVMLFGR